MDSPGAKGNYLVRTLRLFSFSDLADALSFMPKLFVQAYVISECRKIWTSAYTLYASQKITNAKIAVNTFIVIARELIPKFYEDEAWFEGFTE